MNKRGERKKLYFTEADLVLNETKEILRPPKMPRTAVIPVVKDPGTGYLNAAPYSGGVISTDPFIVFFGVKSWDSKLTFQAADQFVISVPRREQLRHMWAMACSVPHGISEIDIAGWTELPSKEIATPGIAECPLNLECRKVSFIQLEQPQRGIVVGEVVGMSLDIDLANMSRSEAVRLLPMHEATKNPYTGLYGPSVLSGELISAAARRKKEPSDVRIRHIHGQASSPDVPHIGSSTATLQKGTKIFRSVNELRRTENTRLFSHSVWPRPAYLLITRGKHGGSEEIVLPVSGGLLMNARPSIQIPIDVNTETYRNIHETGEFTLSIPVREQADLLESSEERPVGSTKYGRVTMMPVSYTHLTLPTN